MKRRIIPSAWSALVLIVGLALVFMVTLRPWATADSAPQTHLNVDPNVPGAYSRTERAWVESTPSHPDAWQVKESLAGTASGDVLFAARGCASCHALDAFGSAGPSLFEATDSKFRRVVREGEEGMPAYSEEALSDAQLTAILDYVRSLTEPTETPSGVLPTPTPFPTATAIPTATPVPTPTPPPTPTTAPGATPLPTATPVPPTATPTPSGEAILLEQGKEVYLKTGSPGGAGCAYCHGIDGRGAGEGASNAPDIRGITDVKVRNSLMDVLDMSDIKLTDAEITAVAAYLQSLP